MTVNKKINNYGKFMKSLTKELIKSIEIGGVITGEGLEVRRTSAGMSYYANTMHHGKRIRRLLGKQENGYNLTKARSALVGLKSKNAADLGSLLEQSDRNRLRFQAAAKIYIERLTKLNGKNVNQKQQQLRDHLCPFFKDTFLDRLSTELVEEYIAQRIRSGAAEGTINTELAALKHMFNKLKEWKFCAERPFVCRMLKPDNIRKETFTEIESSALLEAAKADVDPFTYLFILLGLNTGMRHGELIKIRFDDINFDNARIYLPDTKTGARYQPFPKELIPSLQCHRAMLDDPNGWVFPSNGKSGHRGYMKGQFRRIVCAIGLDPSRYTPHVMRHTLITKLVSNGVAPQTVQLISGHKSLQMVQRYTHISDPIVDSALESAFVG